MVACRNGSLCMAIVAGRNGSLCMAIVAGRNGSLCMAILAWLAIIMAIVFCRNDCYNWRKYITIFIHNRTS